MSIGRKEKGKEGVCQLLVERSADWIRQARRDLESANYMRKGGFNEWACFLSQQAAEKRVRAVFQKVDAEAYGHSVARLFQELSWHNNVKADFIDAGKELDRAYIPTRYPNAHPEGSPYEAYTEADAKRLIGFAEEIVGLCEGLLSKDQPGTCH